MKQLTKIYFDESILAKIKDQAKARKMSVSSLVSSVVADYLADNDPVEVDPDENEDKITIRLYGTEAAMLRTRAKKSGMSPTSYVRNCILFWNMRDLQLYDRELEMSIRDTVYKYDMEIGEIANCLYENMSKEERERLVKRIWENQDKLMDEYFRLGRKRYKKLDKLIKTLEDTIMREDFGDDWKEKHSSRRVID